MHFTIPQLFPLQRREEYPCKFVSTLGPNVTKYDSQYFLHESSFFTIDIFTARLS